MWQAVGPACGDPSLPADRAMRTSIPPRSSRWAAQTRRCQKRRLRLRRQQGCGLLPSTACCRSSGRNEIECGSRCRHRGHRSSVRRQAGPALSDSSLRNERRYRCDAGKPCSGTGTPDPVHLWQLLEASRNATAPFSTSSPPRVTLSIYVIFAIRVEPVESLATPRALAVNF